MNKKHVSTLYRIYLMSGLLLIISAAAIGVGVVPNMSTITQLGTEIHDQRIQLEIFNQERTNIEKTQQDFNLIKNNLDKISKIFIEETDIIAVLSAIENLSEKNEVQQTLSISSTPDKNDEKALRLVMSVNGTWSQTYAYMNDLERLPYYVIVHDVTMSGTADDITISFKADTYAE